MGTRPPTLEEPRKNEPIPDITNPEVDEMVILPIKRKLVRWYLLAILFIVLFVPWTDPDIISKGTDTVYCFSHLRTTLWLTTE